MPGIIIAYGYASALGVLRGRRAAQLLAGRRAARRHAAGRQPPGALARGAPRDAAPRPLGQAGGADGGRAPALSRRAAAARARAAGARGRRRGGRGRPPGALAIGASTGPGAISCRSSSASSSASNPAVEVVLSVSDTQTVIERVAERELELGIVGALGRHRCVEFEPLAARRGRARGAAGAFVRRAGGHVGELRREPLVVMQDGAGVRQVDRGGAAARGRARARVAARARTAGVGQERGDRRVRRRVHLAPAPSRASSPRARCEARVVGLEAARQISSSAARGRSAARPRRSSRLRRTARLIVRWGRERRPCSGSSLSSGLLARDDESVERDRPVASRWGYDGAARTRAETGVEGATGASEKAAADCLVASAAARPSTLQGGVGRTQPGDAQLLVSVPTTYSGAEWTDFFGCARRGEARAAAAEGRTLPESSITTRADPGTAAPGEWRFRHERARALRGGPLRPRATTRRPMPTAGGAAIAARSRPC